MSLTATLLGVLVLTAPGDGAEPAEHPLVPVIQYASERLADIEAQVRDYTCTLVKHERVDGRLLETEHLYVKVRHEQVRDGRVVVPKSVYLRFMAPDLVEGREVIHVRGRHGGQSIVRNGGQRFAYITTSIEPDGDLAMQRNRYPVTEIGVKNLIRRLIEVGTQDLAHDECEVKYYEGAKINGRKCTVMEVIHPVRREYFTYHIARIFIDDELQLPIRYAAWEWPDEQGGKPRLIEEYTYLDLKLNVGLTDWDFDHRNEHYEFRKSYKP